MAPSDIEVLARAWDEISGSSRRRRTTSQPPQPQPVTAHYIASDEARRALSSAEWEVSVSRSALGHAQKACHEYWTSPGGKLDQVYVLHVSRLCGAQKKLADAVTRLNNVQEVFRREDHPSSAFSTAIANVHPEDIYAPCVSSRFPTSDNDTAGNSRDPTLGPDPGGRVRKTPAEVLANGDDLSGPLETSAQHAFNATPDCSPLDHIQEALRSALDERQASRAKYVARSLEHSAQLCELQDAKASAVAAAKMEYLKVSGDLACELQAAQSKVAALEVAVAEKDELVRMRGWELAQARQKAADDLRGARAELETAHDKAAEDVAAALEEGRNSAQAAVARIEQEKQWAIESQATMRSQLNALNGENGRLRGQMESMKARLDAVVRENAAFVSDKVALKMRLDKAAREHEKMLEDATTEKKDLRACLENITCENASLRSRVDVVVLENGRLLEEANTATTAKEDLRARLASVAHEKETLVTERESLQRLLDAVTVENRTLVDEIAASANAKERIEDSMKAFVLDNETLRAQVRDRGKLFEERDALQLRLDKLAPDNEKLLEERDALQRQLHVLTLEHDQLVQNPPAAMHALQSQLDTLTPENAKLREDLNTVRLQLSAATLNHTSLVCTERREKQALQKRLGSAQRQNESLSLQVKADREQLHELRAQSNKLSEQLTAVQRQFDASLMSSEGERAKLDEKLKQAVEDGEAAVAACKEAHAQELADRAIAEEERVDQAIKNGDQRLDEVTKNAKRRIKEEKQKADDAQERLQTELNLSRELGLELESAHRQIGRWRLAKDDMASSLYAERERTRSLEARVTELGKETKPTVFLRKTESAGKRRSMNF